MVDAIPNVIGDGGYQREMQPIIDALPVEALSGNAFIASTNLHQVGSNEELHTKISNPAGSGFNMALVLRKFDIEDTANLLQYRTVLQPTATLSETMTGGNLFLGDTGTAAELTYQVGTPIDMGGFTGTTGFVVPELRIPAIIPQGSSIAFMIEGVGGGGAGSQQYTGLTFVWYEVPA